jgi:ABC-type Na+ efflux pump permease subunit
MFKSPVAVKQKSPECSASGRSVLSAIEGTWSRVTKDFIRALHSKILSTLDPASASIALQSASRPPAFKSPVAVKQKSPECSASGRSVLSAIEGTWSRVTKDFIRALHSKILSTLDPASASIALQSASRPPAFKSPVAVKQKSPECSASGRSVLSAIEGT